MGGQGCSNDDTDSRICGIQHHLEPLTLQDCRMDVQLFKETLQSTQHYLSAPTWTWTSHTSTVFWFYSSFMNFWVVLLQFMLPSLPKVVLFNLPLKNLAKNVFLLSKNSHNTSCFWAIKITKLSYTDLQKYL